MLYLFDANVLIDANRDYYPMTRVPEFWDWLIHHGTEGNIKMPLEVYEEIREGSDELALWAKDHDNKAALLLDEEVDVGLVARVTDEGYAGDLTDDEVEKVGRDPFLLAYALVAPEDRCIVTTERPKPSRKRANRHVPDVCTALNLQCCNTFEFLRALDFKTGWRSG